MITIIGSEHLRDYTIAEARRLEAQAMAQAGGFQEMRDDLGSVAARLKAQIDEAGKVLDSTLLFIAKAGNQVIHLQEEALKLRTIADRLEAERSDGKPVSDDILTIER